MSSFLRLFKMRLLDVLGPSDGFPGPEWSLESRSGMDSEKDGVTGVRRGHPRDYERGKKDLERKGNSYLVKESLWFVKIHTYNH